MDTVGIILLAAGASSRMGRPKQLLPWHQTTLLRHMATMACSATDGPVVVVLGKEAEKCGESLQGLPVEITINPQWQEGMGTSIACGMSALRNAHPHLRAVIVMLCDQVAVSQGLLKNLMQVQADGSYDLVFCDYDDSQGPPALFSQRLFARLLALQGAQGAKQLWQEPHPKTTLKFPQGIHDLDTPEQYEQHLQTQTLTFFHQNGHSFYRPQLNG